MKVKTTCLKCGTAQMLDFGALSLSEALTVPSRLDVPGECPGGFHVELSGWSLLWQFGSALVLVYGDEAKNNAAVKAMLEHEASYRESRRLQYRPLPVLITENEHEQSIVDVA